MHKRDGRSGVGRGAVAGAALAVLLAGAALAPPGSTAQRAGVESVPLIEAADGSVIAAGYKLTPGNVDASGWSEKNKSVLVNFSLVRAEGGDFRAVNVRQVEASLNKKPLPLASDSLKRDSEPIKVLLVIDRSGSMVAKGGAGVDKLQAARESLRYFVKNLGGQDQASVVAFDETQREIVPLTSNKQDLDTKISEIQTSKGDTSLYGSIDDALERAKRAGVKNIIFLSDGKDDTAVAKKAIREGRLNEHKRSNEGRLSVAARNAGISLHTIAVGEQGDTTDKGVDYATLKKISDESSGGTATLIDIPELNRLSGGNPARVNERLTDRLKDVLAFIKKSLKYDYDVRVPLPDLQEGSGELQLDFTFDEGDRQITFPMVYSYTWDRGGGPPIFLRGRVLAPTFLDIVTPVPWGDLGQIYLLLLSPLVLLGLLPSLTNRIGTARELRRMSHSIEQLGRGSILQGKLCPNEMGPGGQLYSFKAGDTVLVCPKCSTPHHLSCWQYNQHQCMNRVCEYQFVVPARVLAKYGVVAEARGQYV